MVRQGTRKRVHSHPPAKIAGGRGPKGGGAEGATGGCEVPVLRWFMGENPGNDWEKHGKIMVEIWENHRKNGASDGKIF